VSTNVSQRSNAGAYLEEVSKPISIPGTQGQEKPAPFSRYDAFEHLCSSLFLEKDNLVAVLTAYFDESYNHLHPDRSDEPLLYTVGCWLSTVERWKKFGRRWASILNEAGIDDFHMNRYESRFPPYDTWSDKKRIRVLQKLHKAIRDTYIYGCVVSVHKAEWDEFMKDDAKLRNSFGRTHYGFCVQACVMLISDWCAKNSFNEEIHYIFAHLNKQGGVLDPLFKRVLSDPKLKSRYRVGKIWSKGFAKDVAQLQAADIQAYEWNKRMANFMSPNARESRKSLKSLVSPEDQHRIDPMYFDKQYLTEWVELDRDMLTTPTPYFE
jgi:hypothetical protein